MALDNKAVPYYYGRFRDSVLSGRTPVPQTISMEMNRIDSLIANPNIYYDRSKVEAWIRFQEGEMTLTDGSDLVLLDSFKLWAEQLWGWYYFIERSVFVPDDSKSGGHYETKRIKKRLINKQFLILGRGGAKSVYQAGNQAYVENVFTATTHGIVTAPTMRQADETIAPIRTAITRARGPLFQFLTEGSLQNTTGSKANRQKLASTKKGIENFMTGSLIDVLPMSIDKLQGYRPMITSIDEWLSGDIREDVIGAVEQGASKLDDYIIIATSSEGTVRNGVGDTIKMELMDILKGVYPNPHVSIWWYQLDDISEVSNPAMWIKANPNLGKTVQYEVYQLDVERAEKAPSARNDILAKRFGIPTEGHTYYFTYEETLPTVRKCDYWSMACTLGADLSQGDDFCAFTFLFPLRNGKFGVKNRSYITELTLAKLPGAMREKYTEFMKEGSLIIMPGTILDINMVYEELRNHIIQAEYDVRGLGFDPYNAKAFVERWTQENGPYSTVKVIQGAKTETVPLGEIKILAGQKMLEFDQELVSYCMGNCITIQDTNGNRKLSKMRREQKIDAVAALMDAYVAYKTFRDRFM
jgi:phage terminase large subunit-like protein